jgi:hypothetical protein
MLVNLTVEFVLKGINLFGVWKRHGLSMSLRGIPCLYQPSSPLCNYVLKDICVYTVL